jgi:hypothetical protein
MNMREIATGRCAPYSCEAAFYIRSGENGERALVVRYGEGYSGPWCPLVDGQRQFGAAIPPHWLDDDVLALLLAPPVGSADPKHTHYPAWEVGARWFGSEYLVHSKALPPVYTLAKQ